MSEAPERIRVWPDYDDHFSPARHDWTGGIWDDTDDASGIEYIRADLSQAAVEALEAKLAKAMKGLEESQEEIDNYIRWEYPSDHPVHERYRKRDYAANPARATLAELTGGKDD